MNELMGSRAPTPLASLPVLTQDEQDDASFRAQDRAWAAVVDLFLLREQQEGLTYESLGKRIGRRRQQVQRWLASAFNMNTRSLGLLAEGLNADLVVELRPRTEALSQRNYHHPSVGARAARNVVAGNGKERTVAEGSGASGSSTTHTTVVRPIKALEDA